MFKRRTLFIIGAGASKEVRFPIGNELAQIIRKKSKLEPLTFEMRPQDPLIYGQFVGCDPGALQGYNRGFNRIHNGILLTNSIDDFLHIHRDDKPVVEVGKALIVRSILEAERGSRLFVSQSNIYNKPNYEQFADTWYVKFMRVFGPGTSVLKISEALKSVSFVVFNYDRSVEHFLFFAFQHLYGIQANEAIRLVKQTEIIHPYGSIGSIDDIPFGGQDSHNYDFRALSGHIKTYTEQIEDPDALHAIRRAVELASGIVFLGFAFHDQNMALLQPTERLQGKQIFGTAYGMSESDTQHVKSAIGYMFPADIGNTPNFHVRLENSLTCAQLFDYYAKSIAG